MRVSRPSGVSGVKHPQYFCVPDPERQSIIVKMYKACSTMACHLRNHGYFAPANFEHEPDARDESPALPGNKMKRLRGNS